MTRKQQQNNQHTIATTAKPNKYQQTKHKGATTTINKEQQQQLLGRRRLGNTGAGYNKCVVWICALEIRAIARPALARRSTSQTRAHGQNLDRHALATYSPTMLTCRLCYTRTHCAHTQKHMRARLDRAKTFIHIQDRSATSQLQIGKRSTAGNFEV